MAQTIRRRSPLRPGADYRHRPYRRGQREPRRHVERIRAEGRRKQSGKKGGRNKRDPRGCRNERNVGPRGGRRERNDGRGEDCQQNGLDGRERLSRQTQDRVQRLEWRGEHERDRPERGDDRSA